MVGRLPSKVRCGTWNSGTPSARTSSGVLPNANASVCAKQLAMSRSWWSPMSWFGSENAMKSHGTSTVPWCKSWWYACWPFVPG